jgi:hypothetical protein
VRETSAIIVSSQVEPVAAGDALGISIRRTIRARRSRATVCARALLVVAALLICKVGSIGQHDLALRVAIYRVGHARIIAQVKRTRASNALSTPIYRTIRARRSRATVRARALLVVTTLLICKVRGIGQHDLALCVAIDRVSFTRTVAQRRGEGIGGTHSASRRLLCRISEIFVGRTLTRRTQGVVGALRSIVAGAEVLIFFGTHLALGVLHV